MSEQPQTATIVEIPRSGPGCLVTVLWFIFIGSWLSLIWNAIAWVLIVLIITMPIGLKMVNMIPRIATLREPSHDYRLVTEGMSSRIVEVDIDQRPFLLRAIYFLLVGWWFSGLWMLVAWAASVTLIGIPLAIWMYNRVPAVTTLRRY